MRQPAAKNIVNPAKLTVRARDSVCEQCHLEGAIRILNSEKDWWDFQAGYELESVFTVYLEAKNAGGVKAVSQVEQLAQSKCAPRSGGRLWCATCHDPHGDPMTDRGQQIKRICQGCHAELSAASHSPGLPGCTSCHMPARAAADVAHAAITDHRIRRRPLLEFDVVEAAPPGRLETGAGGAPEKNLFFHEQRKGGNAKPRYPALWFFFFWGEGALSPPGGSPLFLVFFPPPGGGCLSFAPFGNFFRFNRGFLPNRLFGQVKLVLPAIAPAPSRCPSTGRCR